MDKDNNLILKVENVTKVYPGVTALDNVSFSIKKGEVHALVGENGAGKSTLIKCIMGVEKQNSGHIYLNNGSEWIENKDAIEAQNNGVFANYQDVNIAPNLSVAENYFLGKQPSKNGIINWNDMYNECKKVLDKFDLDINPKAKINTLPLAMQAMITISKISTNDTIRLVIFDEPTALLENEKVEKLFNFIEELKNQGVSIIYISHRLEEIMEICDSVTILKDGKYVDTKKVDEVDKDKLISLMVGRKMTDIYDIKHQQPGQEVLRVENFSDNMNYQDISFNVREGEILGFFGLVGSGRSELMRGIYGVDKRESGEIYIKGEKVNIDSVSKALKNGLGFLTEDRREDGLALPLSIKVNSNMNSYDLISKRNVISLDKEKNRADQSIEDLRIKTPSCNQVVSHLSGGNQQKVVISKLLNTNPDILIFDEPTVGVDVGAKQEIFQIMERLIAEKKAIILISSYLPEVMGLSDRLIVMAKGRITAEYTKAEIEKLHEDDILKKTSV